VEVRVRAVPKARGNEVMGLIDGGDGRFRLKVRIQAPPDKGKANAALAKLLARAWGLPPSRLDLVAGQTDRDKTLLVAGEPAALMARLTTWLAEQETT